MARAAVREQSSADAQEAASLARHEDLREVVRRTAGLLRGIAAARESAAWRVVRLRARRLAGYALVGELLMAEAAGDERLVGDLEQLARDRAAERRRELAT